MLKQNSELRAQAREALRGKWPMAAVAALIYSAIAGGLYSEERKKLIWECCLLDFRNIVVS